MSQQYILVRDVHIQNANALSSPYTIGFPAMTAWLGAMHALQRKIQQTDSDFQHIQFTGIAVSCHEFNLQTYRGPGDFVDSIIGTANPLDKTGARSPFIEEGRCHLNVSLLIEITGINLNYQDAFIQQCTHHLNTMKIASGDVMSIKDVKHVYHYGDDDEKNQRKIQTALLPGYIITERRDLMIQAMKDGQDALDAMLDYLYLYSFIPDEPEVETKPEPKTETENQTKQTASQAQDQPEREPKKYTWKTERKATGPNNEKGWIVPIATGFHGIDTLAQALNQRDETTPHCFAESLVTLGEFKLPHNVNSVDAMMWRYQIDEENHLYQCVNHAQDFETDPATAGPQPIGL